MTDLGFNLRNYISKNGEVNAYWWDGKPNFGDIIGPYLIGKITGKPVVNVRGFRSEAAIFSVGSIITMMDRKGALIWGSGLISDLDEKQVDRLTRAKPRVTAVRGKLTKKILEDRLSWNVPNVFGDPALLLPLYFKPVYSSKKDIVVCPHFSHKKHFSHLQQENNITVIDVADPLENVLTSIASAKVCISSSLHGVIVAQAYGVPWVWVYFEGKHLSGSDLKFLDFFSTLDKFENGIFKIPENASISKNTIEKIAELSTLPNLDIDLDALKNALPL